MCVCVCVTGLDVLQALLYHPRASLAAQCRQGRKDVFLISTTASVVCDDANGLRTTSFKAQEPVCLGSLLLRVLSGSYFKFISE